MNHRVQIPKGLYPRRIKEKLTKKQIGGEWIIEREMMMISKDGTISKFPRYHSSEEEEPTGQSRALNNYGFVDHPELQRIEFASHRLSQRKGNMNGWLIEDEDEPLEHEASYKEQLQTILPQIVNQVTNNVNNENCGNGGNGGNVIPESSRIKRYIAGLALEIQGMLRATQPTIIQSAILRAGILTNEAVSCGTLTKGNEKRKGVEESRNRLTIEGNQNSRNNGNQVKRRAFNVNAVGALQDPNVVTGTFSLNHHYAIVLFDSGADF
nr:reverse transcriptase domain-containing protein [Tanacetum cinerariifolium]